MTYMPPPCDRLLPQVLIVQPDHSSTAMLIDSHCHLDFSEFSHDLDAVVRRAEEAGIAGMVTISTRVKRHPEVRAIAERFSRSLLLGGNASALCA